MRLKHLLYRNIKSLIAVLLSVVAMGINSVHANNPIEDIIDSHGHSNHFNIAKGKGTYLLSGIFEIDFRFLGVKKSNGKAFGIFKQSLIFQDLPVSFTSKVTCLAFDEANGRVWFGGVILKNESEHPSFTTDIHQPGRDVWFRVLDTGKGSEEPDRSTFLGFEGAGGIITSEEYCDAQIWPGPPDDEENARTHPVIEGRILTYP